jgi:hypothetical protein
MTPAQGSRSAAATFCDLVLSAAREEDVMKGKSNPEPVETFEPVVCEQPGLCVGCSDRTQFGLHVDVGAVDATFFVCTDCLATALGGMILMRQKCETEVASDAGH